MTRAEHNRERRGPPAILQVIPSLDTGGAERSTIDMAAALTEAGYRALVVSEGGRLEGQLRAAGGELITLPVASKNPFTIWRNGARLARIIRQENVVLIHARSRAPAWSALKAARKTGIPFVTTYHGIYNAKSALKRRYNAIMARGDMVIANSNFTARHIRERYHLPENRLAVIHRGLDLRDFDPGFVAPHKLEWIRNGWGSDATNRIVFLPGRMTRWKGHRVFIEAFAALQQSDRLPPDVRGVMAGDAQGREDYVHEIETAIENAGLASVLSVRPHIADIAAAYAASDIVVSASTDPEAFGRIPIEAGAMRKPVIATSHGGSEETVLPGRSGLLVPAKDVGALAGALTALFSLPKAELAAMGDAGRAHVEANFTVQAMCAATMDIYRRLTGKS